MLFLKKYIELSIAHNNDNVKQKKILKKIKKGETKYLILQKKYKMIKSSYSYHIGRFITWPFRNLRFLWKLLGKLLQVHGEKTL